MEPRAIVIHPSLTRPHLLLGAERVPVVVTMMLCSYMMFVMFGTSKLGFFLSAALWIALMWIENRMAKEDPIMFKVGIRHLKFHSPFQPSYYPARSYMFSKPPWRPKKWL